MKFLIFLTFAILSLIVITAAGCNAPDETLDVEPEEVVEPVTHPPKFSYGDMIVVGKDGRIAGIIIELNPITDSMGYITDWQYNVMFENNQRLQYKQNEIQLFRKMDWAAPELDQILLNEPPIDPNNAEIENEDAIP